MKMNFKMLMMAAVALMAGLSSCSNDDEIVNGAGGEKTLFLKISNGPSSYAEEAAVGDGTAVKFTSGHLYFVNAAASIVGYKSIGTGGSYDINLNEITGVGTMVTGISGSATSVVVVGNNDLVPINGPIATVKNTIIGVGSQSDYEDVNLYGEADLDDPEGAATFYTAKVDLAPTVARIELDDITYGGNVITAYKVTGIFVDNFEKTAYTNGTVLVNNLSLPTIAPTDYTGASPKYTGFTSLFDYAVAGIGGSTFPKKAPLVSGEVWAYNVLQSPAVPRIIIRIEEIVTVTDSPITFTGPQFITVKGFKDGSSVKIDEFIGGMVYKINAGALVFNDNNLSPEPNKEDIDVEVTIKVAQWKVIDVTPEL